MEISVDIEALSKIYDRASFICSNNALNNYLKQQVNQDDRKNLATCFVAVDNDRNKDKIPGKKRIAGFYTLSSSGIPVNLLPENIARRLPYPVIPVALLGRFAVDAEYEGKGIGSILISDAKQRAKKSDLRAFGLFVEAKDQKSQDFYEKRGFLLLDGQTRQLVLPF